MSAVGGIVTVVSMNVTTSRVAVLATLVISIAVLVLPRPPVSADTGGVPGRARGAVGIVAAGGGHTCVRQVDGGVKCWGLANHGQLGYGDTEIRGDQAGEMGAALPNVALGTGRTARQLATGNTHTCALLDDRTVKCWGENSFGQLGLGDTAPRGKAAGEMGDALPRVDLGPGRTAIAITAGLAHTCALRDDGTVVCWGWNSSGQLGRGDNTAIGDQPTEMGAALRPVDLGTGRTATAVSAGSQHTCAVLDDRTVKCWGRNTYGALGQGHTFPIGNAAGQLGDALPPVDLGTGRDVATVAAGHEHTCALLHDGSLRCWGRNFSGTLGLGHNDDIGDEPGEMGASLPPVDFGPGRTARLVATGNGVTCVVRDDDRLSCWGFGADGRLGTGGIANIGDQPNEMGAGLLPVPLGIGRTVTSVTTGWSTTCAALDDGTVKCWGDGAGGRLGQGNTATLGDEPGEMGDQLPIVALGVGEAKRVRAVVAAPASPATVSAMAGAGSATVSWIAPSDNGGGSVSGYRIQRSGDGGTTWQTTVANSASPTTQAVVTGLAPGQPVRFRVAAINSAGVGIPSLPSVTVTPSGSGGPGGGGGGAGSGGTGGGGTSGAAGHVALDPARILDTRPGAATIDGVAAGAGQLPGGEVLMVQVTGRAGVPDGVDAVVLNLTVHDPVAAGYVTVFPCGSNRPNASNVNYVVGQTIPNAVIVKVGDGGRVCVFSDQTTHLIADVNGYAPAGSGYVALEPARLLDTRAPGGETLDGTAAATGALAGGDEIAVQITGRGGVPASASAVVLNVAVTAPIEAGYVTVWPCGSPRPNASNLNYVAGQTIANAVVVKVGDGGRVCLFSDQTTDLIADVNGALPAGSAFVPLEPARLLDTRPGTVTVDGDSAGAGPLSGGEEIVLQVTGRGGVPATAAAAVLNLTVNDPLEAGYVTAYPCGAARPNASNLNFVAGQTVPNTVIVKIGDGGRVCLFSDQTAHLIADVNGAHP